MSFLYGQIYLDSTAVADARAADQPPSNPDALSVYRLYQDYPNPFNPATVFPYQSPGPVQIDLQVFDFMGRVVASFIRQHKTGGIHEISWTPDGLASGTYLVRLRCADFEEVRKLVLEK
ncbi:MAG TPA: T9SS type A sorting domain-containing protein [bacterium]